MLCKKIFSREKMEVLGINKSLQTRIRHLFEEEYKDYYGNTYKGRFSGLTVQEFLEKVDWKRLISKEKDVGKKVAKTINAILKSQGLPEILPPNPK